MTVTDTFDYLSALTNSALEEATAGVDSLSGQRQTAEARTTAAEFLPYLAGASTLAEYQTRREITAVTLQARIRDRFPADDVPSLVQAGLTHLDTLAQAGVARAEQDRTATRVAQATADAAAAAIGAQIEAEGFWRVRAGIRATLTADLAEQGFCDGVLGTLDPASVSMPDYRTGYHAGARLVATGTDSPLTVSGSRRLAGVGPLDRSLMFTLLLGYPQFARMESRDGSALISDMMEDWQYAVDTGATDMGEFVTAWVNTHGLPGSTDYPEGLKPADHMPGGDNPVTGSTAGFRDFMNEKSGRTAECKHCGLGIAESGGGGVWESQNGGPGADICMANKGTKTQYGGFHTPDRKTIKTSDRSVPTIDSPDGVEYTPAPEWVQRACQRRFEGGGETALDPKNPGHYLHGVSNFWDGPSEIMDNGDGRLIYRNPYTGETDAFDETGYFDKSGQHKPWSSAYDDYTSSLKQGSKTGYCNYCNKRVHQVSTGTWVHSDTLSAPGGSASGSHMAEPQKPPKPGEAGWETMMSSSLQPRQGVGPAPWARGAAIMNRMTPHHDLDQSRYENLDPEEEQKKRKELEDAGGPLHPDRLSHLAGSTTFQCESCKHRFTADPKQGGYPSCPSCGHDLVVHTNKPPHGAPKTSAHTAHAPDTGQQCPSCRQHEVHHYDDQGGYDYCSNCDWSDHPERAHTGSLRHAHLRMVTKVVRTAAADTPWMLYDSTTWMLYAGNQCVATGRAETEAAAQQVLTDYCATHPEPLAMKTLLARDATVTADPGYLWRLLPVGLSISSAFFAEGTSWMKPHSDGPTWQKPYYFEPKHEKCSSCGIGWMVNGVCSRCDHEAKTSAFFADDSVAPVSSGEDGLKPITVDHARHQQARVQEANEDLRNRGLQAMSPVPPVKTTEATAQPRLADLNGVPPLQRVKQAVHEEAFGSERYQHLDVTFPAQGWAGADYNPNHGPAAHNRPIPDVRIHDWPDWWSQGAPRAPGMGSKHTAAWIDAARQVVDNKQFETVGPGGDVVPTQWRGDNVDTKRNDGSVVLDSFTASMLVQIYDALSPENQAKFGALSLDKAVDVGWKLVERTKASKQASRHTADLGSPEKCAFCDKPPTTKAEWLDSTGNRVVSTNHYCDDHQSSAYNWGGQVTVKQAAQFPGGDGAGGGQPAPTGNPISTPTVPTSTRPQVSPEAPAPPPMPAETVDPSGGPSGTGDLGAGTLAPAQPMPSGPSMYEQPTTAQRTEAKLARMASQIQADNPQVNPADALRLARMTVAQFPGMVSEGAGYACPTCQNFGKVTRYEVDPENPRGPRIPQPPETCPTCQGKGR